MRTLDDLLQLARAIRVRLLQENRDPAQGVLFVTRDEESLLRMSPFGYEWIELDPNHRRLHGLEVRVIGERQRCEHDPVSPGSTMQMREVRLFRCVLCGTERELL